MQNFLSYFAFILRFIIIIFIRVVGREEVKHQDTHCYMAMGNVFRTTLDNRNIE